MHRSNKIDVRYDLHLPADLSVTDTGSSNLQRSCRLAAVG